MVRKAKSGEVVHAAAEGAAGIYAGVVAEVDRTPDANRRRNGGLLTAIALATLALSSAQEARAQDWSLDRVIGAGRDVGDAVQRDEGYRQDMRAYEAQVAQIDRIIAQRQIELRILEDFRDGREAPEGGYTYTISMPGGGTETIRTDSDYTVQWREEYGQVRRERDALIARYPERAEEFRSRARTQIAGITSRLGQRHFEVVQQIADLVSQRGELRSSQRSTTYDRRDNAAATAQWLARVLGRN